MLRPSLPFRVRLLGSVPHVDYILIRVIDYGRLQWCSVVRGRDTQNPAVTGGNACFCGGESGVSPSLIPARESPRVQVFADSAGRAKPPSDERRSDSYRMATILRRCSYATSTPIPSDVDVTDRFGSDSSEIESPLSDYTRTTVSKPESTVWFAGPSTGKSSREIGNFRGARRLPAVVRAVEHLREGLGPVGGPVTFRLQDEE